MSRVRILSIRILWRASDAVNTYLDIRIIYGQENIVRSSVLDTNINIQFNRTVALVIKKGSFIYYGVLQAVNLNCFTWNWL